MKAILLSLLFFLFVGCATTNSARYRGLFEDELNANRESINHGSITQAISDLSMLLEMDPKNSDARFLRASAYQKQEQYTKAKDDYLTLLNYDPNHSKAHYNLGMILAYKLVNRQEALAHFDYFITLDMHHPKVFEVAKIMVSLDRQDQHDSSAIDKIVEDVLANQAMIRANEQDNLDQKKKLIIKSLKTSPTSSRLNFAFASILEEEGLINEAIKYYKAALQVNPTNANCHKNLSRLLSMTAQVDEAKIHLFKASLFQIK